MQIHTALIAGLGVKAAFVNWTHEPETRRVVRSVGTHSLKSFPSFIRGIPEYSTSCDLAEGWECTGQKEQLA